MRGALGTQLGISNVVTEPAGWGERAFCEADPKVVLYAMVERWRRARGQACGNGQFCTPSSPLIDFTRGGGEIKVRLTEIIMMRPGMGNRQNCKLSQVPIKQKIKLNYASRLRPTTARWRRRQPRGRWNSRWRTKWAHCCVKSWRLLMFAFLNLRLRAPSSTENKESLRVLFYLLVFYVRASHAPFSQRTTQMEI